MTRLLAAAFGVWFAFGCSEPSPQGENELQCAEASARLGKLECLHRIANDADWQALTLPMMAVDQVRSTKYLVPAKANARLAPLFMNASEHELHREFLLQVFPQLFAGLTTKDYLELLFDPTRREYYAGAVTSYRTPKAQIELGFTLAGDPSTTGSTTCDDVRRVREVLRARLPACELYAVPSDREQQGFFPDCGVPVIDPAQVEYEVYHPAAAFGRVRRLHASELQPAVEAATIGFQDILILENAPSDIETVVSGIVSGERQAPLSHLAVRSASRGTPNCYLQDAYGYLESWQDQLVRLECAPEGLQVRAATSDEARAYWDRLKPAPVAIADPDRDFVDLISLDEIAVETSDERAQGMARFGAKGRNLAWLRQELDPKLTPRGFVVPVAHYLRFIETNQWSVDLGDGMAPHSFAETLSTWQADPSFQSDAALRREKLLALQDAFKAADCDAELVDRVGQVMVQSFGDAKSGARFRSSSNAEDGAYFNGAGLYDSFTGCYADDTDTDETGPSACDPSESNERGVCRALRKVWASLFNPKAYDERAFYGIDASRVAMAVLVNERSGTEDANMVAFSSNPLSRGDARYLVNAQVGELPVVSPQPGMWPEQDLLSLEDGKVVKIERALGSSQLPDDEHVVSDEQLSELGGYLSQIAAAYPFDIEAPKGHTLLLDTEWKLMPDGTLRVKQVRPFLR
jgi:hypothetical protein